MKDIDSKKNETRIYLRILSSIGLTSIPLYLFILYLLPLEQIDKGYIQMSIAELIENDADLRAIKSAQRDPPKLSLFSTLTNFNKEHYQSNVPLSIILDDIRVNAFKDNKKDLLKKIDLIINQHEQTNPFDKLLKNQKDYFENIRHKTGENYSAIEYDINNLADEMDNKNKLVNEYLADSTTSFRLSIIGLFLSVIIGIWGLTSANRAHKQAMNLLEKFNNAGKVDGGI